MVLAGGEGRRLFPLTKDRAKPAVPFAGKYRIIDFALNNFINSGFFKIKVLTQYKSDSLNTHLARAWHLEPGLNQYVDAVPPQMRRGPIWFRGSADAVYQNLNLIFDEEPQNVCVFGGDHIYKMDVRQMLDYHVEKKADLTIAGIPVPLEEARKFGVIEIDKAWRVIGFQEKPDSPKPIPGRPDFALASMGNYIFNTNIMIEELEVDALRDSLHDFGRNIITKMFSCRNVYCYDFATNVIPGMQPGEKGYWRDVGDIDTYWATSMDLVSVSPVFDLYNPYWPLRSQVLNLPPAKFVFADRDKGRMGFATDSIVAEGCILSGGHIDRSILFPKVRVSSFSRIDESILMHGVHVDRYAMIRKAIIDKGVYVPPHHEIGYDLEEDAKKFYVSDGGVVVVPKGTVLA
jgi:glucose-1-phosphate adenylyltransferase